MSFTIEEKMFVVPLLGSLTASNREFINYSFRLVEEGIRRINKADKFLKVPIEIKTPPDFSVGNNIRVRVEYVKSSGRQIFFYGNVIDLETGIVLMSVDKSQDYIRLCDFKDYINTIMEASSSEAGKFVPVDWATIKYYLERFKLYDVDLYEFFEGLYNETYGFGTEGSESFIKDRLSNVSGKAEAFTVEHYNRCLRYMQEIQANLDRLFSGNILTRSILTPQIMHDFKEYMANSVGASNVDDEPLVMGEFFKSWGGKSRQNSITYIGENKIGNSESNPFNVYDRDKRNRVKKKGDYRDRKVHDAVLYLSAEVNMRSKGKVAWSGDIPNRSELIALNFIDILDVAGEEEYEEFYQMTEEEDLDDLKELAKRLKVEDIVKGAKLTAIRRGAKKKNFSDNLWTEFINRNSDLNMRYRVTPGIPGYLPSEPYKDYAGNTGHEGTFISDEVHGFISRYVERVTKRLESL